MKNIWIVSDTHFNHYNILKFKDGGGKLLRGSRFKSLKEMDETLIENWNRVVKPGDKVYHLGDVFFGNSGWMHSQWPRLMGQKRLIVGNHDDIRFLSSGSFFRKVEMWRAFKEFGLLLTHVPVDVSVLSRVGDDGINIHGHIHHNQSPTSRHRCVCVEQTDYTPIHIEELRVR